jgi:phosphoenolpyruvate-protein kinase (PTS system EI component)
VSLVYEAAREKGILLGGVCGEVAGGPEVVSKPVEAGATLSTALPSTPGIEKLVGEL